MNNNEEGFLVQYAAERRVSHNHLVSIKEFSCLNQKRNFQAKFKMLKPFFSTVLVADVTDNFFTINMCIQYTLSVHYHCGHSKDEKGDLEACEAVNNGERCAGTTDQPAPSESRRTEDCTECVADAAAAEFAASPSTQPESEPKSV